MILIIIHCSYFYDRELFTFRCSCFCVYEVDGVLKPPPNGIQDSSKGPRRPGDAEALLTLASKSFSPLPHGTFRSAQVRAYDDRA